MIQKASRTEYVYFVLVMIVFIAFMIVMMIHEIDNLWIWIGYIGLWTWVEMKVAKNIHLKWYTWLWIILGLSALDLLIIHLLH